MPNDPDVYSGPGEVWRGSTLLLECQSIQVQLATNNNTVKTMKKGRAGHTKGFNEYNITVASAVPAAGMEVDWDEVAERGLPETLRFKLAGKWRTYKGDIRTVDTGSNTDQPNTVSFTMSAKRVSSSR